jgi:hypothetical protein
MASTPNVDACEIVVGQRVHCILYGGKNGIVVAIHGEQAPHTIRPILGAIGVTGGNAYFDIVWDDGTESHRVPEGLVRQSVQWRLLPGVATADEIANARAKVAIRKAETAAKQAEADKAYALARDEAIAKHPNLVRVAEGEFGSGKHAAKNLRIELKVAFPKFKFSVTSDHSSLRVHWTDGPTAAQVEAIADRYCSGGFDSMQDMAYDAPTPFTNLFGGARYISCSREISDELLSKALDALFERLPGNLEGVPKPSVDRLRTSYQPIPHLDRLSICAAAKFIASRWDCLSASFQPSRRFNGEDWLLWTDGAACCPPLG